ncbi:hypothetical protein CkaCkLH20_12311 [Colletotrichum karsti]|uniref:Uncharacterized protein n=1 Tax=Colletotrichum karsti TaxID=1095194 RepID=A0A9P6LF64_9PEZI|nr:uncharacterized protein CkaCkLH20_12311 [Colletotrichum karsti]KAF9870225.1 hypothetical protein CkaCkLH20_12311 [Colletotrichum karsti]
MDHGTTDQQPLLRRGLPGEARCRQDARESLEQDLVVVGEPPTAADPTISPVGNGLGRPNDAGRLENERLIDNVGQPGTNTPHESTAKGDKQARTEEFNLNENATWYPFWLRANILAIFLGLFVSFLIALSIMLWYSRHNQGLFTAKLGYHLVWHFGPTAVLTVIAGFWARVELQAAKYMPWIALCRGHTHKTADFDLDYVSMIPPTVLIQSFRRKHFILFLVVAASLLIKVQIVLAPGLYRVVNIHTSQPADAKLLDAFKESDIGPQDSFWDTDRSPFYTARAMNDFNMSYPFGVTSDLAYQRFSPRGTPNSPINILVDGLSASMHCLKLESFSVRNVTLGRGRKNFRGHDVDFALDFEGCKNVPFRASLIYTPYPEKMKEHWTVNGTFANTRPCGNLPQRDRQFIYFASTVIQSPQNSTRPEITDASGVICTSTLEISRVAVVDDGISPTASRASNKAQLLHNTDFFKTLGESVDHQNAMNWAFHIWSSGKRNYGPVDIWSRLEGKVPQNGSTSQETTEIMYDSVIGLTNRLGPLIAHYRLRSEEDTIVTGERLVGVARLLINSQIGFSMLAVFFLLVSIIGFALFWHRKDSRIYHRDPATLLGNLIFIRDHPELMGQAFAQGNESSKDWTRKSFVPFALITANRTGFTVIVLASVLFQVESVPEHIDVKLEQNSWFGQKNMTWPDKDRDFANERGYLNSLSSLLFRREEGKFTYPKNTFDDLVFPAIGEVPPSTLDASRNISVDITVPAARFTGTCKKLQDNACKINVTSDRTSYKNLKKSANSYTAEVSIPITCLNGSSATIEATQSVGNGLSPTNSSYFAGAFDLKFDYDCQPIEFSSKRSSVSMTFAPSLLQTYFWGERDHTNQRFDFSRIWICDYSWVKVMAQTHLVMVGGELLLDQTQPPRFDPSNSTPWDPPISSLQFTDTGIQAVVNKDRRKLVQNRTATYLLVGILSIVALVHLVTLLSTILRRRFGWRRGLLDMNAKGLAPDGFGSINMTTALLSPSNAIQHMPSQKLSKDDIYEQLSGLRFRLGWFRREHDQTRHFTIGVMGDGELTWVGKKTDAEEKDLEDVYYSD